jgi:hypothetical protein
MSRKYCHVGTRDSASPVALGRRGVRSSAVEADEDGRRQEFRLSSRRFERIGGAPALLARERQHPHRARVLGCSGRIAASGLPINSAIHRFIRWTGDARGWR